MDLLPRHLRRLADELLDVTPVLVIEGARQAGKSTLAHQFVPGGLSTVVTLDDPQVRAFASLDPVGFLQSAGAGRLVIDEVQRMPSLMLPLKLAVDLDRRPGRFVLTGSANLLRVPGSEDSLAGRALTLRVQPFSQGEIEQRVDDWVTRLSADPAGAIGRQPDRGDIVGRMVRGGYPAVQGLSPRAMGLWLKGYADRLLERDSADLGTLQVPVLRRLLMLVAAAPGAELVLERFAETLGVARSTVQRYLDILEALFITTTLPQWSRSLTSRQTRRAKCYVTDSGLLAALNNHTAERLLSPLGVDHLGGVVETFVVNELRRQQGWSETPFELSHFRDRNGAEVDVIIETDRGVIAVEVKAAGSAQTRDFKHLALLRDRLGDECIAGVVMHLGPAGRVGDRLWAMPVTSLWA